MRKNSFYLRRQAGIVHILLIPVILLLIGGYLIFNKGALNKVVTVGSPAPTLVDNQKTYSENGVYFKYPSYLTLENKGGEYLVLLKDKNDQTTSSSILDIDLNLSHENSDYSMLVSFWKDKLVEEDVQDIENGVRLYGKGSRESEGEVFTVVLLKRGTDAVVLVTTKTDENDMRVFDDILSTFKFTE